MAYNSPYSGAEVDDAVAKRHTQNTDTKLDEGGANEVSASEIRSSIDGAGTMSTQDANSVAITGGSIDATIAYDNTNSDLTSTQVQTAIDELDAKKLNIGDLTSSVTFFPTDSASDIGGYGKLVTTTSDSDYDTVAVNVNTGTFTGTGNLVGSLASAPDVLTGNTTPISVTTVGQVRRLTGNVNDSASFYFEVYKRDSVGTETLIGTSDVTTKVSLATYAEFSASALISDTAFSETDRVVLKFYANVVDGSGNVDYQFQYGGATPVRTLFPVPVSVVPTNTGTIATQDADNVNITGGSITGITDLAVADGGTGASTLASGEVLLGNGTGAVTTASRSGIDTRSTFPPSAHTHTSSDITDFSSAASSAAPVQSVNGQTGTVSLSIPSPANNATITVSGGSGLSGSGDFTTDQSTNETITLSHADTSSQGSVNNSGNTVIQDVTLDTYGHVTGLASTTLSIPAAANNATITISGGSGLSGSGAFTTDQSFNETITLTHADTSTLNGTYGSTADGTKIDTITVDANGHVTAITTGGTGDISGVTAGTGLTGGGTSGTVTLNLNTTAGAVGTLGFFVAVDAVMGGALNLDPGSTVSSSYLYWASVEENVATGGTYLNFAGGPSGTWRCLGYVRSGGGSEYNASLFIRIS